MSHKFSPSCGCLVCQMYYGEPATSPRAEANKFLIKENEQLKEKLKIVNKEYQILWLEHDKCLSNKRLELSQFKLTQEMNQAKADELANKTKAIKDLSLSKPMMNVMMKSLGATEVPQNGSERPQSAPKDYQVMKSPKNTQKAKKQDILKELRESL